MTDDDAYLAEGKANSGPLSGFRILDLSRVLSGPAATMLLADQGADVIKIEPLKGDITRHAGMGRDGMTSAFLSINRGKRAVCVDLHSSEGIQIVKEIAAGCDALVQNFRPGAADGMGLGFEAIKAVNPTIVYASISGFGETGPYAKKRVYDPIIQALSGITDIQADSAVGRPRMMRTVIPDKTTALTAAQAITAALLQRERTGRGQHIKLAMLDAMIAFLWPEGMVNLTLVDEEQDLRLGQLAQDLVFKTTDSYITAGAMSDKEWEGLCLALNKKEWLEDSRFNTTSGRFKNAKVRIEETGKVLATDTSKAWLERLDAHGVPCAPILNRHEMLKHEQVVNNNIISEYEHPGLGRVRQPRSAARFEFQDESRFPLAPALGQHNRDVLLEIGRSESEIQRLHKEGILFSKARS
jgi:crotonobetainyl-CoA:carnitine CoA-transferase CaiB-like acyl-CoA transferase